MNKNEKEWMKKFKESLNTKKMAYCGNTGEAAFIKTEIMDFCEMLGRYMFENSLVQVREFKINFYIIIIIKKMYE